MFTELNARPCLLTSLDIDSMDVLNLVIALHKRTGIDIPESDYGKMITIDGAVAYLTAKSGG